MTSKVLNQIDYVVHIYTSCVWHGLIVPCEIGIASTDTFSNGWSNTYLLVIDLRQEKWSFKDAYINKHIFSEDHGLFWPPRHYLRFDRPLVNTKSVKLANLSHELGCLVQNELPRVGGWTPLLGMKNAFQKQLLRKYCPELHVVDLESHVPNFPKVIEITWGDGYGKPASHQNYHANSDKALCARLIAWYYARFIESNRSGEESAFTRRLIKIPASCSRDGYKKKDAIEADGNTTKSCKLVGTEFGSSDENYDRRVSRLVGDMFEACSLNAKDHVNRKTIKIRTLLAASQILGFTWEKLIELIHTHTRIHSDVAKKLCELEPVHKENVEKFLAQEFVPNDKLKKLLKRLSGQHQFNRLDKIAAVDGLASSKRYDCTRYLENMCYSWKAPDDDSGALPTTVFSLPAATADENEEEEEEEDEEKDVSFAKRDHVHMVRRLYDELEKCLPAEERMAPYVYTVLSECIKSVTGTELSTEEQKLPPKVLEKLKSVYLSGIGEENVRQLAREIKVAKDFETKKKKKTQRSN